MTTPPLPTFPDKPERIVQPLVRRPGTRHTSRKLALALRQLTSPRRNCWSWQPRNGETSRFASAGSERSWGSNGISQNASGDDPLRVWGPAPVAPRNSAHAWAGPGQNLVRDVTHAQRVMLNVA